MSARTGATEPAAYFRAARELADLAAAACGGASERRFRIAGARVTFRVANRALAAKLLPALAHLADRSASGAGPADLTVHLWESQASGVPMLPAPWRPEELRVNGEIPGFLAAGVYAHFNVFHNALTMIDPIRREAIYWIGGADQVPDHESASPLFALFHTWFSGRGLAMVHAAAVGLPEGAALIVGANGAGKSNSCLACLDSALRYIGDDRCLVGGGDAPAVHSLYSSAKTNPEDLAHFPLLQRATAGIGRLANGKAVYFLNEIAPERLMAGAPLKAVLLPRIVGAGPTRLAPGNAMEAFRLVAPYAALHWPSASRSAIETLARLFRELPCYRLELGADRRAVAGVLQALLQTRP